MEDLSKRYYRIGDVASILNIPTSTLRFWEKEFTIIKPVRNQKNTRLYTPKDIETIKMIHFLVKEKGLKLDAAQALIRRNRDGVSKQFEVIERLKGIKAKLGQDGIKYHTKQNYNQAEKGLFSSVPQNGAAALANHKIETDKCK